MLHHLQLHMLVLIYLFIPKFPGFVIPYSEAAMFFLSEPGNNTGVYNEKEVKKLWENEISWLGNDKYPKKLSWFQVLVIVGLQIHVGMSRF